MATDRDKIQEVIGKTEDLFEKNLTYISAGALILTLTFIEKIIPLQDTSAVICLVIGWCFLVLSLLLNLSSHLISKYFLNKTMLEIDKNGDEKYLKSIYLKVIRRNKRIDCINWITVVLLILGISFIVIFASINSVQKASQNLRDELKITKVEMQDPIYYHSQNKKSIIMTNETSNNPNEGKKICNEGKTIPVLTHQTGYEEKGLTIPLIKPQPSQSMPSNTNQPKTSEK